MCDGKRDAACAVASACSLAASACGSVELRDVTMAVMKCQVLVVPAATVTAVGGGVVHTMASVVMFPSSP